MEGYKVLFTYLPLELHQWVDEMKKQTNITKTDIVESIMQDAFVNLTASDIKRLFDNVKLEHAKKHA